MFVRFAAFAQALLLAAVAVSATYVPEKRQSTFILSLKLICAC